MSWLLWQGWQKGLNEFRFPFWPPHSTGRSYLKEFISKHTDSIKGSILEFHPSYYNELADRANTQRYDVINPHAAEGVTVVADLMSEHTPDLDGQYDLILCTQVLEHVPNPFVAVKTLSRWLKPKGRVIVTVPSAYPYHAHPGDFWRFTRDSVQLLFEEWEMLDLRCYGNRLTVVAAYWYWMVEDLPQEALWEQDEDNPTIVCLLAEKRV
jgi:SAM-dependent methyltransferase